MKHPLTHRLFSAWLALLVLTASVGLTVQQHTCRVSGTHTAAVIFTPAHHGCPPPAAEQGGSHATPKAQVKSSCCEFGAHFHKLDSPSPELTWVKSLVPAVLPVWLSSSEWPSAPAAPLLKGAARWHAGDASPPLRAGRTLLTFVCTLIV
ncbi:hypothetical protein [Hymenobacter fodinae]|uniref:DUF2946 domain-containing protein n=1 Tax=Hymenobacter fodinae TaxID=2510796 RepID=A0A4Z0P7F0_9BACT|nr:hypothetical protein [Hymenobacter fodinae]TGE08221.1 hypothetical protein EU556_10875 [Hymenobacter fodinae]